MKTITLGLSLACATCICFAQVEEPLCPRHIETPDYPAIARVAHVSGKVSLTLTIDANGNVVGVKESGTTQGPAVLAAYAVSNVRTWTFAKPASAPYNQIIVYDFELRDTGPKSQAKVSFDLPSRITIIDVSETLNTSQSNRTTN